MEQEYKYMVCTRCFTFNHAPYIVDAMNGFTMQETTFPVVTLIVDDASTDGEPEVICQYLADHFQDPYRTEETDYAHIICARHRTNLNCEFVVFLLKYNHYSIKKPKIPYLYEWLDNAKYIALCEGDDYWIHPEKLQIQAEFMEKHPDISYTCTRYNIFDVKTGVISLASNYFFDKLENKEKDVFVFQREAPFLMGWITKTPTCMYPRKKYNYEFGKQFKYGRDVHLVYYLLSKGSGACLSLIGAAYRLNPSSTFGGKSILEQVEQNYYVYEELYKKTNDNVMRKKAMEFYLILFKNRVHGFRFPNNILQFYAVFFKLPKYILSIIKKMFCYNDKQYENAD